jgi:hypothetical protein
MTILAKRRSNRPLTDFACRCLHDFVSSPPTNSYQSVQKNTTVRVLIDGSLRTFLVLLYEEEIFRLTFSGKKLLPVKLSFTSFSDSHGQPSTTTAERLNGLLDTAGGLGLIPEGVRVFRDQEHYRTYIGKGDEKVAIGKGLFTSVFLKSDSEKFAFAGYESIVESFREEDM